MLFCGTCYEPISIILDYHQCQSGCPSTSGAHMYLPQLEFVLLPSEVELTATF